jgi:mRNA interferase MazF
MMPWSTRNSPARKQMVSRMKRGDIFFAQLDPTEGAEIQKTRPVLIVSNDVANRASSLVTVLPLSSNTTRIFPFEVELLTQDTGLAKNSKAMAQQVRTIDKSRLSHKRSGQLDARKMLLVDAAMRVHLGL